MEDSGVFLRGTTQVVEGWHTGLFESKRWRKSSFGIHLIVVPH